MADASGGGSGKKYREVTLAAILFGVIVGTIMNAAITYAGLKIGFTIVGSAIAAVLGFGVLRGVLRKGTILEVNIGQTVGSAVNTPNSGVIFTVPVLFLIGIPLVQAGTPNANFWLITLACVTGAILGGAFIIPLRKQMIDIERLRFPSATAVGAILKSPGAGAAKSVLLVVGIVVSALLALPAQLPQITSPAALEDLDGLVFEEKISYEDKLRTEMIADWIEAGAAPEAVLEHGAALEAVRVARAVREAAASPTAAMNEAKRAAEERLVEVRAEAIAAVNEGWADGAHTISGYPDELANRVLAIVSGADADEDGAADFTWDSLRDTKAGWAADPVWGYADLGIRMGRETQADAPAVDYAFDGLGAADADGPDEVLTVDVDRDRGGRPDLLVDNVNIDVGRLIGLPDEMELLIAIAPFALGAGYLTGKAGLFVLAGGVLAYLVLNPIVYGLGLMPATVEAHQAADYGFAAINRPLGIGLLLGGALAGVVASFPAIREALKSIAVSSVAKTKSASDELGLKVLIAAVLGAFLFLFVAADFTATKPINVNDPVTGYPIAQTAERIEANGYAIAFESAETFATWESWTDEQREGYLESIQADREGLLSALGLPAHVRALIIALIGAGWIWFAGIIIAQCTGMTDWSPISGMALITVVLVMMLAGVGDQLGAIMIGAALCVAITCAADMMADLKTGYIVGAVPKRQQIVELIATGIGPVISMLVLLLIAQANVEKFGVAMGPGTDTTAPQAQALQAVITGVQGGDMPYVLYGAGALMGALLGIGSFSGLGVLVGLSMYLPMNYIATYGVGCVIAIVVAKLKGPRWAEEWGVPLAAGFIVGDALLGLGVNFVVLLQS